MNISMAEFNWKENIENLAKGSIYALISIAVVFAILIIIMFIVMIINRINIKSSKVKSEVVTQPTTPAKKAITMEDIKDEDMMVAVLVATIDYRSQTKKDVRLVDVKQIG